MSITSFRFSLLPVESIKSRHDGKIPEEIPELKAVYDTSSLSLEEEPFNYWNRFDMKLLEEAFSKLLPSGDS